MKKNLFAFAALGLLAAGLCSCAAWTGRDTASSDFDRETRADDIRVREDKARMNLSTLESAVADYVKTERRTPENLDVLIPKYLAEMPSLDVPACGGESSKVKIYPPSVLRDGQVDGSSIKGTGWWGYAFDEDRVVVFVDCLKPALSGVPWYQVRGAY
ncbi:MAG: hypothetical protein ACHQ49_17860 [Elusimicrobiota bacterium]